MIFAIVAAVLAYRRANENGRNGLLWAFIAAGVFVGTQVGISVGAGILLGFGAGIFGWPEEIFDDPRFVWPITGVAIAVSILATWLILRYLDRPAVPDVPTDLPPPPPPTFNQSS